MKSSAEFSKKIDESTSSEQAKILKQIARRKRQQIQVLRDNPESMEMYRKHFAKTFVNDFEDNLVDDNIILNEEEMMRKAEEIFSVDAISQVILERPKGKAPGLSGLTNELLIPVSETLAPVIQVLFKACYISGSIPSSWKKAAICPVPKKGDLTEINNYRPISLTENMRKVFEKCIETDMKRSMRSLDIAQGGFRDQRSTLDQIVSLHLTMKSQKGRSLVAFLDIAKAYDSVPRTLLWRKCKDIGICDATIRMLKALFNHNMSKITVGKKISNGLIHPAGVLQGSILSPLLYSIFINDLAMALDSGPKVSVKDWRGNIFLYADDVAFS